MAVRDGLDVFVERHRTCDNGQIWTSAAEVAARVGDRLTEFGWETAVAFDLRYDALGTIGLAGIEA